VTPPAPDAASVTVVIPAKDAASTIEATVRSILASAPARPRPRVLVVDDGSMDDTAAMAAAIDPSVAVVAGRGVGPGAARNDGAGRVTTEFLAFCDADDQWAPGRLDADLAILRSDATIGILLGRTRFDTDEPALLAGHNFDNPDRTALIPHFGAATMRTAAFVDVGPIDESLANYEDYEWFVRARELPGRLVTHDRVVQWSWRHSKSLSHVQPPAARDLLRLLQQSANRQRASGTPLPALTDLRRLPRDDTP
jgi:glycosyltransferase involved in cell wall biosynthesis